MRGKSVELIRERLLDVEQRISATVGTARALGLLRLAEILEERAAALAQLAACKTAVPNHVVENEIALGEQALRIWEALASF